MGRSILNVSALLLSTACVVMAVVTVVATKKDQRLQMQLQQQVSALQSESQTISGTEQISRNILTDLGNAAVGNPSIREMLSRHGYTLSTNSVPSAAATSSVPSVATPPFITPPVTPVAAPEQKEKEIPVIKVSEKPAPVSVTTPPVSAPVESAPADKNANAKGDTKP